MRWLTEQTVNLTDLVSTLRQDKSDLLQIVPFVLHPLHNDKGDFDPLPCWLEFCNSWEDLAFAVRRSPVPRPDQTPLSWMSLPAFEDRWDRGRCLVRRATATRYPGGRIGTLELYRGLLWTMTPPPKPTPITIQSDSNL